MDGTFTTGGITFQLEGFDLVASNMQRWFQGQTDKRRQAAERLASLAEPYMKSSAPWHDVTGDARSSLKATTEHDLTVSTVVLAHGVDYGAALETMSGGRWGVLLPTLGWLVTQLQDVIGDMR